jgi:vancomycin aglycone glucosyltransferase
MKSLNIILATVGSRGDVQPMVALARTLKGRGHSVTVAAPPDFGDWIQQEGFKFAPVGSDIKKYLHDNPGALGGSAAEMYRSGKAFFDSQLQLQANDLRVACQGADMVVWAGLAIAAMAVAEGMKLPVLGVVYSSCVVPSARHAPPAFPRHGLPDWVNRLLWVINGYVTGKLVGRPFNALRAQFALPPVRFRKFMMQTNFIIAADAGLMPLDDAWGPNIRRGNFIYLDDPRPLPADLQDWLDDGEPPVYVGFGSMSGKGTDHVEKVVHEALSATGRRCLISAGWAGLGTRGMPSDASRWRVVGEVSHQSLFPRMAAVVHHGGSGTTANALRAGVPQVVLPLILDQFHHAHRLQLAGLAPKAASMEKVTAQQLATAIEAAIAMPPEARQAVSARLRASDGAGDAADALEALAMANLTKSAITWATT